MKYGDCRGVALDAIKQGETAPEKGRMRLHDSGGG